MVSAPFAAHRRPVDQINDVLREWYIWSRSQSAETGYPSINVTCKLWRCSRQYDDANGAFEADAHSVEMEVVDRAIEGIEHPHRGALHALARNLVTGLSVWRSGRVDAVDALHITAQAREMLAKRLGISER